MLKGAAPAAEAIGRKERALLEVRSGPVRENGHNGLKQGVCHMPMSGAKRKLRIVPLEVAPPPAARSAVRTLALECEGLAALKAALDAELREPFNRAVAILAAAAGRVIVSGIGKSGHIGQKLAATFASTGTPAFFVHASEASHGDLGMITADDVIIALSS